MKRHVSYLRALGALVWVRHGSKQNLCLPGRKYTATATIYAAVIPPVYDEAMGHRLSGTGYRARLIGVTEAGRERAIAEVRERAAKRTSGRSGRPVKPRSAAAGSGASKRCSPPAGTGREPHSRGGYHPPREAEVSGGLKDTLCAPGIPTRTKTTTRSSHCRGTGRPVRQVEQDIAIAQQVRPRIGWTQAAGLRQLAYALRPLIDRGLDAESIVTELASWSRTEQSAGIGTSWRPSRPAAYITAQLAAGALDAVPPPPPAPGPAPELTPAEAQRTAALRADTMIRMMILQARQQVLGLQQQDAIPPLITDPTAWDRALARGAANQDPQVLISYVHAHGIDAATDLYGAGLIARLASRYPAALPADLFWTSPTLQPATSGSVLPPLEIDREALAAVHTEEATGLLLLDEDDQEQTDVTGREPDLEERCPGCGRSNRGRCWRCRQAAAPTANSRAVPDLAVTIPQPRPAAMPGRQVCTSCGTAPSTFSGRCGRCAVTGRDRSRAIRLKGR
ncbi:hypothetical protein FNQ90_01095 [Streptomyces alkaliphilus]|uniref:Uncharacterized protein n=1 Tax=Streptomyces alkaliphilus TaxID=1472722 RepID=A0A7W3XZN6_9ACTN|nr:hypothetical protein [Streptomyces alkaliphilus]MBB0242739.1 hypothetical protein [Streptomyces alkaliphilus]